MLIGAIFFGLWLWLAFWAASQIREAVWRMEYSKGEAYNVGDEYKKASDA